MKPKFFFVYVNAIGYKLEKYRHFQAACCILPATILAIKLHQKFTLNHVHIHVVRFRFGCYTLVTSWLLPLIRKLTPTLEFAHSSHVRFLWFDLPWIATTVVCDHFLYRMNDLRKYYEAHVMKKYCTRNDNLWNHILLLEMICRL